MDIIRPVRYHVKLLYGDMENAARVKYPLIFCVPPHIISINVDITITRKKREPP